MQSILPASFFDRPALRIARELLGKSLVREWRGRRIEAMITETEAYIGPHDLACHAAKGRTARTEVLYAAPGTIYVYFVYGMHWMLNVVTCEEGYPAAVLIRGVEGISGPARVTKHFHISGTLNGATAGEGSGLWVEDRGIVIPPSAIRRTPRIGVDYAGKWAEKEYRFVVMSHKR